MKMDPLESFILRNREQFETGEPDPGIFKKIMAGSKPGFFRHTRRLIQAAAVLVLLIVSASVLLLLNPHANNTDMYESGLQRKYPELQEAEIYYTQLLNRKLFEAEDLLLQNPAMKEELIRDFREMDSLFFSLKSDLQDNVSNRDVIQAMILNYRMRIDVLEDLLEEFKQDNNENFKKTGEISL